MGTEAPGWLRRELPAAEDAATRPPDEDVAGAPGLTTFIAEGCEVDGRLVIKSSIRIESEFRGALESDDTVVVGERAAVEADIRARRVVICGAVVGRVVGSREVIVHATGRLHGSVETPSLVIERGAFFTGETRMYRPEVAARRGLARAAAVASPPAAGAAVPD